MSACHQKKRYRICFVAPTISRYYQKKGFGGAELQVLWLSKMFLSEGHEVTVITEDFGQGNESIIDGVRIVKRSLRFLGGKKLYLFVDILPYLLCLRRQKADFYIVKTPHLLLPILCLFRTIYPRAKIIKICASNWDCEKGTNLIGKLYELAIRRMDRVVFQTENQRVMAEHELGITGPVIPNIYIPDQAIKEVPKDIDVLWVGAFDDNKRPDLLLKIAKQLPQYKFGVIAKPCPMSFIRIEQDLKSQNNVDYIGTIPFEETGYYFSRAKILLCTSLIEGFPNVFLQAWQSQAAVVSVSFSCDDILEKYECGLFSRTNEQTIKDIDTLLRDDEQRKQLGINGWNYVSNHHLTEFLKPLYKNVLEEIFHKERS